MTRWDKSGTMADSHLTYIGAWSPPSAYRERARYDVYPRSGGPQLGWVARYRDGWAAFDSEREGVKKRTRWEAAIAMWGDPSGDGLVDGRDQKDGGVVAG